MHPPSRIFTLRTALLLLASFAAIERPAVAQEAGKSSALEPYSVFVAQDEAFARCGPSKDYYRTDRLRHGQQLEVYVETEGDWLGVRPPQDSFCWVPASAVRLEQQSDVGEVIEDKTVAWIGTHLGRARRYRWQVQLAEGEAVTVLGRSERDGPDGPQLWYRIVPPSGEFRWIHRDDVVESAEELIATAQQKIREDLDVSSSKSDSEATRRAPQNQLAAAPRVDKFSRQVTDEAERSSRDGSSRRTGVPERADTARLQARSEDGAGRSVLQGPPQRTSGLPLTEPPRRAAGGKVAAVSNEAPVGSGLRRQWQAPATAAEVPPARRESPTSLASAEPRARSAEDASFVERTAGQLPLNPSRPNPAPREPGQASADTRVAQAYATSGAGARPQREPLSPELAAAVEQIRREVDVADVPQMQLILSRLMSKQASAAEVGPVVQAASRWAASTSDELTSVRAELLAQRAREYQQVARRREAAAAPNRPASPVIPASAETALSIPSPVARNASPEPAPGDAPGGADASGNAASGQFLESGFLVQVYSARPNSPPFALTDATGRTVAYVTPSPGVNLRIHLNSEIQVDGNQGFLQGLNTPHILVTRAVRTQQ